ncbi:MAG: hypothetical protein JWO72_1986 [Caulobacteraceae bacterium]|nr:hypothetical protein [Caulobacteraceae bacterium]
MSKIIAAAVILALGAPALASAAPARSDSDTVQITVKYADLNLTAPTGQAALHSRVTQAAAQICGGRPDTLLDVAGGQRFEACMAKTVGAALAKVPAPRMVAEAQAPQG